MSLEWPVRVKDFLSSLGLQRPIIQAPMAGGLTTPELVAAVSNAGGLGSIGAGLLTPENLQAAIQSTKKLTNKLFAVNLFFPTPNERVEEKIQKIYQIMAKYRQALNMPSMDKPNVVSPPDFNAQMEILIREKIKIISFTFGAPNRKTISELHDYQIIVIGTATNVREALQLEELGYDMIVAQGSEAGGHRATFLGDFKTSLIGTMALVPQIVDAVKIPVIAAGGIMDGRGLLASLVLGASAVQMGTAFLTCPEAGGHPKYKEAILKSTEESTVITSVFSGRPARGIRNQFINEMEQYRDELPDYPWQQSLTLPIRLQAAQQNRPEFLSLWAGQATRLSQSKPAAQLIQEISDQALSLISSV